jgi:pimeloyl-ACP methyl ester carboxylesterase
MGGMTIQHYLKDCDPKVKAAVMLCAVPRQGVWTLIGKLLMEHPLKFIESTLKASWLPILKNPKRLKQLMLRADFPDSELEGVQEKLQDESFWVFLQMLFNLPEVPQKHIPILVVGGAEDYLFPISQSLSLAKTYQAKSFILPNGSHSLMMETDWEKSAEKIQEFMAELTFN